MAVQEAVEEEIPQGMEVMEAMVGVEGVHMKEVLELAEPMVETEVQAHPVTESGQKADVLENPPPLVQSIMDRHIQEAQEAQPRHLEGAQEEAVAAVDVEPEEVTAVQVYTDPNLAQEAVAELQAGKVVMVRLSIRLLLQEWADMDTAQEAEEVEVQKNGTMVLEIPSTILVEEAEAEV